MTDVFTDPKSDGTGEQPKPKEQGDILSELVGEGKKFATVEDLAKGKLAADSFIEELKGEQKEMRDTLRELEDRLNKVGTVKDALSEASGGQAGNQSQQVPTEELLKLVDERLNARTQAQTARANQEVANAELLKHFKGDEAKAREHLREEAGRLGLSTDALRQMAQEAPKAFLRLVGVTQSESPKGTTFKSQDNPDSANVTAGLRNKSYYDNLRKQLGHKFYEPSIQQQRMRDRLELGERFNT